MAETGYSFVSCSHKSLAEGVVKPDTYPIIDLILGKQRQPVITPVLQDTLRSYLAQGGNLLVSGTNLFSDSWGNAQDRTFVEEVLKGKLASRKQLRIPLRIYKRQIHVPDTSEPYLLLDRVGRRCTSGG